ncbi:hypothetical protein P3L51_28160 [Streptomyces sp. PSRA5]|uniref:hypothetical protein n=1 Tax=Streptomyces panacea TaxID=3035064 RepID=UPI00339BB317
MWTASPSPWRADSGSLDDLVRAAADAGFAPLRTAAAEPRVGHLGGYRGYFGFAYLVLGV